MSYRTNREKRSDESNTVRRYLTDSKNAMQTKCKQRFMQVSNAWRTKSNTSTC